MPDTVGDLWGRYSRHLSRLSPYTRDGYCKIWRLRIEPHLGDVDVGCLTVGAVEDWLVDLLDAGLSWNTVRNAKVTLGAMLTFAARREEGVTLPHVAQRAQLPGEEPVSRVVMPEAGAVAGVLRDLLVSDFELAVFERIAAVTGARRGECAALRLDDVFSDGLMLDEAVRMEQVDGRAVLSIGATKTRQRRFVVCDDLTMATVEAWVAAGPDGPPERLLFPAPDGGPRHPDHWSRRWRRACAARGLATSQHQLRHLCASLTAEALGLRPAQERLGHARVTTTERYTHVRAAQGTAAAEVMANALASHTGRPSDP